jgi:hypothetical protein
MTVPTGLFRLSVVFKPTFHYNSNQDTGHKLGCDIQQELCHRLSPFFREACPRLLYEKIEVKAIRKGAFIWRGLCYH